MREIKFRAWMPNQGHMADWRNLQEVLNNVGWENFNEGEKTLMQWIGLKDQDGKEIYEGDVVQCYVGGVPEENLLPVPRHKGVVKFTSYGTQIGCYRLEYCVNLTVLGNIYENPELGEHFL